MSIITVCNHKGGTGKTTTSMHLAAALNLVGYKTLVIDLDPQGYLTCMMDVETSEIKYASQNLFDSGGSLIGIEVLNLPSFDLLPCTDGMISKAQKLTSVTDMFRLKESLMGQSSYDLIILDTAAAITVYVLNALVASDILMIPVTPELQSVHGAQQTWDTAKEIREKWNPGLKAAMFVLTNVHGRKKVHRQYSKYMRQKYGDLVMDTQVRTCSSMAVACTDGRTVFETHILSRGARDYAAVADELIKHVLTPFNQ
ncbi:MAG: ParA family protein [Bacteroidetes bacterium]|nr:ParA family protein [Bacteroidota bacterium]MCY4234272.1 ParA family protein [Bacteroidota bacterium]